jgi:exosortase D (VPLPA-CTERM-specific)
MNGIEQAPARSADGIRLWCLVLPITLGLLSYLYWDSLVFMVHIWMVDDNYSHGLLVPVVSVFLIWASRKRLAALPLQGSWWGVPVVLLGVGLYAVGILSTLMVLEHLSFWLLLVGLTLSAIGPRGTRAVMFPLGFLLTMIPLPQFLHQGLSGELQLVSSSLGVSLLHLVGVTAFREGNVIDLGPVQLQVVEACSGLRYLFPLAALALLCAYLMKGAMWKRLALFLSTVPISILLNGARIAMIGVLVDHYGESAAEGFTHLFEGWLIFLASLAILFAEIWWLGRLGSVRPRSLADLLDFSRLLGEAPRAAGSPRRVSRYAVAPSYICAVLLLAPAAAWSMQSITPDSKTPARDTFVDFPMGIGTWLGRSQVMEAMYVQTLKFDDYLLADYLDSAHRAAPVNVYVAYYGAQHSGQSVHSPKTCIPGGGWEITSFDRITVNGAPFRDPRANRAVIQKGDQQQVVLYWFQQRGRMIANEYVVKLYLLWDAVTRQRTDGALVRLTSALQPGESVEAVESRLIAFAGIMQPELKRFVPN